MRQSFTMSVIHIHTQEQAQAELDRQRDMRKARAILRQQRMQEDSEYAQQVRTKESQTCKKYRDKKRKIIKEDPLHVDAGKEATRKAEAREAVRAKQQADHAQERELIVEKVKQRYCSSKLSLLMSFRIFELDAQFADLRVREQEWPTPLPHAKPIYKIFVTHRYL
jgi:hypothetical protein